MAGALGITEEECGSEAFLAFFSGEQSRVQDLKSWCTPYALSIMGNPYYNNCPFGNGNGYGDGRAVSVGEVMVNGQRWEMQLKGGGTTPFCRGADGRAVLRSSVREFLASEAMHNLGVETTRALSLIVSGSETVSRPWYSGATDGPDVWDPDTRIVEPCAITTRVAPSFLRVGHVDLFARRARATGGEEQRKQHRQMVEHALFREYPDILPDGALEERALAMLEAAADRLGAMVAGWLRVGFCQGNFNADNCLVGGRTMDYGPFGWIEQYDPQFAKWVGSGHHFAFMNQPQAAVANYGTLVEAVAPLFPSKQQVQQVHSRGSDRIKAKAKDTWRVKLGLTQEGAAAAEVLWQELEPLLAKSQVDYTLFWRQLAVIAEQPAADDEALLSPLAEAFYQPLGSLAAAWTAWLRQWLGVLRGIVPGARVRISGIAQKPELNGQTCNVLKWNSSKVRWGVRLDDGSEVALRASNLEAVGAGQEGEPGEEAAAAAAAAAAQRLRAANPKYVPREWMLIEAYEKAGRGDYSVVHELYNLFLNPYGEQPEMEAKYFRRAPPETLVKGGCAKMS